MKYQREPETRLPGWLWFFLILPLGLIVLLLYRRRQELVARLPPRVQQRLAQPMIQPRYTEPDSIPLEIHQGEAGFGETAHMEEEIDAEVPVDAEDSAGYISRAVDEPINLSEEIPAPGPTEPTTESTNIAEETGTPAPIPTAEETPVEPDDLEIIEGIGPSIGGLLQDRGIHTFRQLAAMPIEQLTEILASARLAHLADPTTWPEQARLAADGRWDELRSLQSTLKAGRRPKTE